jgi:hypothetical protein
MTDVDLGEVIKEIMDLKVRQVKALEELVVEIRRLRVTGIQA